MSAPSPFGGPQTYSPPTNSPDALQRIEKNTADLVRWVKILVAAVTVLVIINLLFLI